MFDTMLLEDEALRTASLDVDSLEEASWRAFDPAEQLSPGDDTATLPAGFDTMPPGLFLAAALFSIDPTGLSGHDRIRVLQAHARMVSYFQARLYGDMASVPGHLIEEGETDPDDADQAAATEIRAALRLTRRAADSELTFALELQRRLPAVWDALVAGDIDVRRARTIVHGTVHLPDATAARAVADQILEMAPRLTTGQLAARLRKLCVEVNPDDARNRYEAAVDERRVVMEPTPAGTAELVGLDLPPDRAAAAMSHINQLARSLRRKGEARTMDQLRSDVFLDLLTGEAPARHGRQTGGVDLHVDLATLTGLTETPGELNGYGPVVADIARQVAERQQDGTWQWTIIDGATGMATDTGTTRRRPTAAQRRRVLAQNPTCIFPGCRMPATDSDIDHREPWSQGGLTATTNLGPLCRHDHGNRHNYGWQYQPLPGGDYLWTSPLGHTYATSGRSP